MKVYEFVGQFLDYDFDEKEMKDFGEHKISIQAPNYEAAVAWALAYCPEYIRDNDEETNLFFRLSKGE